ncbi:protein-tyrosine-phosphatase MKP1 [Nicotiana tomentosiformis]|uniref:protein-tyrosine-phosphatase MKP1 n=1 Tax=Nicotiana tomentosiformis TaxID=4098 RepID=UPI00051B11C9|nr:protein-tyrosine-phosphatase MKP1 [Nicotiana tomentosiformis]
MPGKEDASAGGADGGSQEPCQLINGRSRMYWRSASWSSSRTSLPPLNPDIDRDGLDPNNSQGRRPLTPRSQQSFKARSCLPPLQPLAIARRSLDEWPRAGSDDIGEWPLPSTPSGRDSSSNSERLKLDLSNIHRNPETNGGLVRREKIAFFDKECSKVADHIYLGGDAVARDKDILKQNGITHVLNCVGFVCPEYFKSDFVYRTLWLQDSPSEDITSILYDVFDYFEDVREQHGKVFVHCCQGVSRSTSLVIAYRMWREGQSFDDAFEYVKAARGIADPNMGFACQLLQCQKRVHAFPLSPSSLLRMYRVAPHSPYDPLHLVPKMLNDPSPSVLDSRGAFIIHIPSAIYVWIGKKCETIMERDARGAVCQIVRYEKVQCPIITVTEGEEPLYFWDAFSNFLPLMDKLKNGGDVVDSSSKVCPGERKVDMYNVDFEIFQKATSGGFVPPFASCETDHETRLPVRESSWSMLRRKFVSGNMRDFVFSSKSGISRIYPDSMFITLDNCATKQLHSSSMLSSSSSCSSSSPSTISLSSTSSSSSSSSTSSPPYLSPDSISSDSSINSKCLSDSPVVSPSVIFCADLTSSTPSNSSVSVLPSKISPQSISKTSKYIDVNFTSQASSQSSPVLSKKFPLSIAERRGSLSKCLKLPMLTDDFERKAGPSKSVANEQGRDIGIAEVTNVFSNESSTVGEILQSPQEINGSRIDELHRSLGILSMVNPSDKETDLFSGFHESRKETPCNERSCTAVLNGITDTGAASCYLMQPVVYRWPGLEKLASCSIDDLDSKGAYIFVTPTSGFGKDAGRTVFVWVGRSFSCETSKIWQVNHKGLDDPGEIDWKQVATDVLHHMVLPIDTNIKVVKENEEPAEFLALLSSR